MPCRPKAYAPSAADGLWTVTRACLTSSVTHAVAAGVDSASSPQPGIAATKREVEIPAPAPQTPAAAARPAVGAAPSAAQQAGSSTAPDLAASAQRAAELQAVQMWRNLADTISPASSRQTIAEWKQRLLEMREPERFASLDDESKQWLQKALPEFELAEQAIKYMDALINEAEVRAGLGVRWLWLCDACGCCAVLCLCCVGAVRSCPCPA